jgi:hypothetical protein
MVGLAWRAWGCAALGMLFFLAVVAGVILTGLSRSW